MKLISKKTICATLTLSLALSGCASSVNVAIDPSSIQNKTKFDADYKQCQDIAKTYDLSQDTGTNAALGAVAGGAVVAGVATAVAGAIFAPAIPFILAGAALGGGVTGGFTKSKESEAREAILADCLNQRGYKAFGAARVR
jgi:hypothetical protein